MGNKEERKKEKGREGRSGWLTGCEVSHITVASNPKSTPRWEWEEGENGVGGMGWGKRGLTKKNKKF